MRFYVAAAAVVLLTACGTSTPTPPAAVPPPAAPATPALTPPATPAGSTPQSFAVDKDSCPPTGANKNGTPLESTSDGGLRNMAKRHIPAGPTPSTLNLADFALLQADVNQTTGVDAAQKKSLFAPTRDALHHLMTAHGSVSEGDLVQVVAYVTTARDEHAETVNCEGTDGNDIHLSLGAQGATEYEGIVAEIIPQLPKPTGWDAGTLNRLHTAQLPVLVVGGLTYDKVCAAFLRELVERGLQIEAGLLVVTDGAKGLHAAVREVCGSAALLQRCQWHKRENVLQYLPDRYRSTVRRKLQAAYEQPTYEAAKRALGKLRGELTLLNASAAASLDEGLEETLTLHRLGVFAELGTSLKTTNALESIHARVESRTAKVDHWKNSEQKPRWPRDRTPGSRTTAATH